MQNAFEDRDDCVRRPERPARRSNYRPYEIQTRTFAFAANVLRLVNQLPRDVSGQVIARQLARSGTSIGANVEEAQGSPSRAEFARRMGIARSEAREALYWLRLIAELGLVRTSRAEMLLKEADELVRILVTIVRRARKSH